MSRMNIKIVFLLIIVSCGGCERLTSPNKPASVIVEPVKIQESSPTVTVSGVLIPRDRVEIKANHVARIAEVFVNKGDRVVQGTPLMKFSEEELSLKLDQLRAAKKEAESLLEKNAYLIKNRDRLLEEGKIDKTQYEGIEIENANSEASFNRIKADLNLAESNFTRLQLTSPISGVVVEKYASPMQMAAEGQVLFILLNIDPILVSFPLTSDESTGIAVGTPLKIWIEDLGNTEYNATVSYIGPEINLTGRTFDVYASISNPNYVLKSGMQATAQFTSTAIHKIIVVPSSAIIKRDRDKYVFTVNNGIARQTKVRIRNIDNNTAEISSGLNENDLVVVKGAQNLQDGMSVEMWRR